LQYINLRAYIPPICREAAESTLKVKKTGVCINLFLCKY
jgi:hypothetical protein